MPLPETRPDISSGAALVVGGGIGGMQAALDLAAGGIKVYLVESQSAIGGVMAKLDKTFPTNDCAMCTMAPRLVEVGRHKDIEILTLSEVKEVRGEAGRFSVTVERRPRFVIESKCTGCAACTTACPVTLPSEFDHGLGKRKAIYRPYPQAVPNTFAISRRGMPPCEAGCPIHQGGPGYVNLIAQQRFDEALQVILRDNPLPSICGRICTHPCTEACSRGRVDDPLNLPALKRFVTDLGGNYQLPRPHPNVVRRPEQVAIIGSGPAGLLCAYELVHLGYHPVVFEAAPEAGGMLVMGIPAFRLPRDVLRAEMDRLREVGVEIRLNTPVGSSPSLDDLRRQYAAVFVAIGAQTERNLGVAGEQLPGVLGGLEFLRRVNLRKPFLPGRRVAVIGGGNSALDAARTALRCGAEQVTIVYRRTRAEMPADVREIEDAEHEGVQFKFLTAPKSFIAGGDGRVAGIKCMTMRLGAPDASGRPTPTLVPNSEFVIPCDAVVVTVGQQPDLASFGERLGLDTTKWGTLKADPVTLETGIPGVFAGGDCVSGPDVVVTAMAAGKKAANSIDRWLNAQDMRADREFEGPFQTAYDVDTTGVSVSRQLHIPKLDPAARRTTFAEVQTGYTREQAIAEAERCLSCGICCSCHLCSDACEAHAIDYEMLPHNLELDVGAIVLAPGYETFDPVATPQYGYGRFPNVLTALEFERVLSASGPYDGHVLRPKDRREPKRIAFIQCVGSRDDARDYCSSVCCMYATKAAIMTKEHLGEEAQCDIFFMDLRAFGKGFEQYYNRAKELGVRYIRCRPPMVEENPETHDLTLRYLAEGDIKTSAVYDMVVLSVGMQPPKDAVGLAKRFGIALNPLGFCETPPFHPASSSRPGVFVAGPFVEPKDIPETVMQASAAAAQALALLKDARGSLITAREFPKEQEEDGAEPRIGVFVCHCGTNIGGVVNVPAVTEYARTLPNVVCAEENLFTCSNDTQEGIKQRIAEFKLTRVVVASCTPRTHEPLFRNTVREAGMNPYLFEMANIRDHCSWVHRHEPDAATEKAKDLVRMAVAKSRLLQPLHRLSVPVHKSALVIGGGLAGMTAAVSIADQGFDVSLVEREPELGGQLRHAHYLLGGASPQAELSRRREEVLHHPRIRSYTGASIENVAGTIGNFTTTLQFDGGPAEVEHGVFVVATGAREHSPTEYLYGRDPRVMTQRQLEQRLASGGGDGLLHANGKGAQETVVMIQCVGSRDSERPYCSRVCCTEAMKNALRIKAIAPETNVYVLYRDLRTYGFRESSYTEARRQGVAFVRYDSSCKPVVEAHATGLRVSVLDQTLSLPLAIAADAVVLSVGIEPHEENRRLAQLLKVPVNSEGFFLEAHMKLRPVDFATDGIFLCGLAHSPKDLEETILQSQATAARAAAILTQDHLEMEATISEVVDERCDGCAYCVDTCPYQAITLVEYMSSGNVKRVVEVDETTCKGCGCCQATCPKNGIFIRGFTLEQIEAQVHAAMGVT